MYIALLVCLVNWMGGGGRGFVYFFGFLILALLRFLDRSVGSSPSVFNFLVLLVVVWKLFVELVPSLLLSYVYCISTPVSASGELCCVFPVFVPPFVLSAV